jgi:hypothetical protein
LEEYYCGLAAQCRSLKRQSQGPFARLIQDSSGFRAMARKRTKRSSPRRKRKKPSVTPKSRSFKRLRRGPKSGKEPSARTRAQQPAKPLRIFAKPQFGQQMARRIAAAAPTTGFDFAATLAGKTTHFQVYYQTGFANGPAIAQGVLATCERDYNAQIAFFSGFALPTFPVSILIGPGIGGAYHYGCSAVDIYCDGDSSAHPDIDLTRMLAVAEEVEVFEAAQNKGWDCGASNGEGLSRVLATELYPAELDGFSTAAAWLDSPRADWITKTDPTDQNAVSTGCAVLFLNYLRYQLNYSWQEIIQAAGATLEETYRVLTGKSGGFAPFKALLDSHFPPGQPSGLSTDNPFPL